MPLPIKRTGESRDDFISRCMGNETMKKEFSDRDQRLTVCSSQFSNNMINIKTNLFSGYNVRVEVFEGQEHLVAPVVILTEGVHCGSGGCKLYTNDVLSTLPEAWNGRPLPVLHPEVGGGAVSANTPQLIQDQSIGFLFNVIYVNGKLKGEVWINKEKAERISPEVLHIIESRQSLEVSTGLWSFDIDEAGDWQGEHYDAIIESVTPDHLALLPGQTGACSVRDGCGLRNNKGGEKDMKQVGKMAVDYLMLNKSLKKVIATGVKDGYTSYEKVELSEKEQRHFIDVVENKLSFSDIHMKLQREFDTMDRPNVKIHWVVDVFENEVVYRVENMQTNESTLFKQSYTVTENDEIELGEEVQEVKEKREFVPVANNNKNKEVKSNMATDDTKKKCCPEKVKALIDNKDSKFVEGDKEFLEALSEEQLTKMEPVVNEVEVEKEVKVPADPKTVKKEDVLTDNELDALSHGEKLLKESKDAVIKKILDNSKTYSTEELEGMKITDLERMASLIPEKSVNFGPGGPAPLDDNREHEETALGLPGEHYNKELVGNGKKETE